MTTTIKPHSQFLDVAGKKTQLLTGGNGPPLLYLHSAGGETEWTRFHGMLAEHFTVYLPAHPGFASSEGLDEVDHISDYAWHYVDLMQQLQLSGVPVVGFSLGAWTACETAILRPELFSKMMLVDAAGLHVDGAPMPELFIDDFDKLKRLLFFDPESPVVDEAMPTSLEDSRILLYLRAREATARVGWNPYLHNPKLPEHLYRIACPVKILWGREDKLIPLAHGEKYAELLPSAELVVFDECGHMLPFEKPEAFVEEVVKFLA
jgi:pimeloyl-ACP methyl ester carboxylesterase